LGHAVNNEMIEPYLYSCDSVITEVNKEFIDFTGFTMDELIGKSLIEISNMLRINSQGYLEDIENEYSYYIFTKEYEAREVTISCIFLESKNEKVYFFKEKPNARIEDKNTYLEQICKDNEIGISLFSVPDLILLRANQKRLDFCDYPYNKKENSIGKKIKETMTGYEESNVEKHFINVIKTGKSYYATEVKYDNFKRGVIYWDASLVPIYVDGQVKYIVQTLVDVTEKIVNRKLLDEEAKVITIQKEELEAIIENVSDELIICDKNGIVHREVSGSPIYDSEGNFIAGVLVSRDIEDRLKRQETLLLKTQYDLMNRTIENLDLNYTLISYPDAKIKYMNSNAFNYLRKINQQGESLSSHIGKDAYETFKFNMNEKDAINNKLKELIENKVSHCFFHRKVFIAGKETFLKVMYQPLYNRNNEVTEVVTIGIDITEEIKAKYKMEEVLKMQEAFFANVSHELKTPLNVIFSANQLMKLYLKSNMLENNEEKISNGIDIVRQNCFRLTKLINNIVDLSKMEGGFLKLNLSNENIVQVTEDIVQSVSDYIKVKGINIIFDTNVEEKVIACDTNNIERIMLNLISNAIKFTNQNGSIYINFYDKGGIVEISVKDTGIGINKKDLTKIFERFHQVDKSLSRNSEGTGIGLSLVKSLVELHGGKIGVESTLGEGTIFKVELPVKTVEEREIIKQIKPMNSKIEMINIEFSDIYSI